MPRWCLPHLLLRAGVCTGSVGSRSPAADAAVIYCLVMQRDYLESQRQKEAQLLKRQLGPCHGLQSGPRGQAQSLTPGSSRLDLPVVNSSVAAPPNIRCSWVCWPLASFSNLSASVRDICRPMSANLHDLGLGAGAFIPQVADAGVPVRMSMSSCPFVLFSKLGLTESISRLMPGSRGQVRQRLPAKSN